MCDLLALWLERRPRSEWLLCTRYGGQLDGRYVREMTKRKALAAGIPEARRVSPHVLRHVFASDLLRKTRNVVLVQKALGHSNLATTMIYTHISDPELEEALRQPRTGNRPSTR